MKVEDAEFAVQEAARQQQYLRSDKACIVLASYGTQKNKKVPRITLAMGEKAQLRLLGSNAYILMDHYYDLVNLPGGIHTDLYDDDFVSTSIGWSKRMVGDARRVLVDNGWMWKRRYHSEDHKTLWEIYLSQTTVTIAKQAGDSNEAG